MLYMMGMWCCAIRPLSGVCCVVVGLRACARVCGVMVCVDLCFEAIGQRVTRGGPGRKFDALEFLDGAPIKRAFFSGYGGVWTDDGYRYVVDGAYRASLGADRVVYGPLDVVGDSVRDVFERAYYYFGCRKLGQVQGDSAFRGAVREFELSFKDETGETTICKLSAFSDDFSNDGSDDEIVGFSLVATENLQRGYAFPLTFGFKSSAVLDPRKIEPDGARHSVVAVNEGDLVNIHDWFGAASFMNYACQACASVFRDEDFEQCWVARERGKGGELTMYYGDEENLAWCCGPSGQGRGTCLTNRVLCGKLNLGESDLAKAVDVWNGFGGAQLSSEDKSKGDEIFVVGTEWSPGHKRLYAIVTNLTTVALDEVVLKRLFCSGTNKISASGVQMWSNLYFKSSCLVSYADYYSYRNEEWAKILGEYESALDNYLSFSAVGEPVE